MANRYAQELRNEQRTRDRRPAHCGGTRTSSPASMPCNGPGVIVDTANRTDDAADLFVTGHTHQPATA